MGNIKRINAIQVGRDAPTNDDILWLDITPNVLTLKYKYDGVWTSCNTISSINWGSLGGVITNQTDLSNALDAKAPKVFSAAGKIVVTDTNSELITSGVNASKLATLDSLGTASVKDVPVSGNASSDQVVLGNDTRLKKTLDDFSKGTDSSDIVATDTINQAFSKVENKIDKVYNIGLKTLSFKYDSSSLPKLRYYKTVDGVTTEITSTDVYLELPTTNRFILSYKDLRDEAVLLNLNCVKSGTTYYLSSIAEGKFIGSTTSFNLFKLEVTSIATSITVSILNIG